MKWLLLSFLAFMLAAPPIAVHASPDDPLSLADDLNEAADVFVQALATCQAPTLTPSAPVDLGAMITTNGTVSPVQEVAALSRCSNSPAKAPVVLAYDHSFESGGDGYLSPGIVQVWRPPALQRE